MAICAQPNLTVSYSSKFRTTAALESLIQHHPHWDHVKQSLTRGTLYPSDLYPPKIAYNTYKLLSHEAIASQQPTWPQSPNSS
eukprot:12544433-Ditylum_brightwellii.AAC.1